jgi:MFS superfamily sulfate permease-like transporter
LPVAEQSGLRSKRQPPIRRFRDERVSSFETLQNDLAESVLAPGQRVGRSMAYGSAASMGAALAYYTAFSIAPLLIIAIAVAGLVFGRDAAQEAVVGQLQGLLGDAGGSAIGSD